MIFSSILKLFKRIKRPRAEPPKWVPFYERETPQYKVSEYGSPTSWLVEINYESYQFVYPETASTHAEALEPALSRHNELLDKLKADTQ